MKNEPDVKCTPCGHQWKQHGNRTGHCSNCHSTFEGGTLFDWHQRVAEDGSITCKTEHSEDWNPKLEWTGQSWRKPFTKPEGWE